MGDTLDVILVNRRNQNDDFRTVLSAKMCVRVLVILMLTAAAAVGAELHVYPVAGTPIQDVTCGAGDTSLCMIGGYDEDVMCGNGLC